MPRNILLAIILATGLGSPALAQPQPSDPEVLRLIDRLNPTRGIRMPSSDPANPRSDPATPSLTPAAPGDNNTALVQPPAATTAPPPRETTAPAGVAAISMTVNFAIGSATLSPQAAASLASLGRARSSADLAPYRFRIEGHTDTVGDAGTNMLLSQRRAEAVRDFLTKNFRVAPARLVAVGMGEGQLLVPTADGTSEPANRRVQVLNLGS